MDDQTKSLLARLRELYGRSVEELSKPGPLTQVGFEARRDFHDAWLEAAPAILRALEEHERLVSALEYLPKSAAGNRRRANEQARG